MTYSVYFEMIIDYCNFSLIILYLLDKLSNEFYIFILTFETNKEEAVTISKRKNDREGRISGYSNKQPTIKKMASECGT